MGLRPGGRFSVFEIGGFSHVLFYVGADIVLEHVRVDSSIFFHELLDDGFELFPVYVSFVLDESEIH